MRKNKKQKNKGFTLIELLVVVAIIGLLSSIVLSSLAVAREKAQDSKVAQEVHSINLAIQLHITETGDFPNTGDAVTHCLSSETCYYASAPININKAYALMSNKIAPLSGNPEAIIGPAKYKGPMYKCSTSACTSAVIITTVNANTCPNGTSVHNNLVSTSYGSVCESPADGVGGEITGSSVY